jgi:hypothetical protein
MNKQKQSNELYPVLDTVDLSWMWHCSEDPKNVLDYTELVADPKIAEALNKAAAMGFRDALRKMEELELIEMGDIDRNPKHFDQEKWNDCFNCG